MKDSIPPRMKTEVIGQHKYQKKLIFTQHGLPIWIGNGFLKRRTGLSFVYENMKVAEDSPRKC